MMLNIGGDQADKSYRYKMPAIQTKVEGRGNGIKTALVNIVDIAKALHTVPEYPIKFLGIELGAQSLYDQKTDRGIVNGKHEPADVQNLLTKFINIFVLCPNCKLPEHYLQVVGKKKNPSIVVDCAACGFNGPLPTSHKLTTFIYANPPPTTRKGAHTAKNDDDNEQDAKEEPVMSKRSSKKNAASPEDEPEADVWHTDTSDAAQKQRKMEEFGSITEDQKQKYKKVEEIMMQAQAMGTPDAPAVVLKIYLVSGDRTTTEILSELRRLQISRGLDEPQKIKVLFEALLDPHEAKTIHEQFAAHAALFKKIAVDKSSATQFIACIEDFVGEIHPGLLSRTPLILQSLYEADVLDEQTILDWAASPPEASWFVKKEAAAAVRAKAQPFVKWLEEAGDDDEEEEEDE